MSMFVSAIATMTPWPRLFCHAAFALMSDPAAPPPWPVFSR